MYNLKPISFMGQQTIRLSQCLGCSIPYNECGWRAGLLRLQKEENVTIWKQKWSIRLILY